MDVAPSRKLPRRRLRRVLLGLAVVVAAIGVAMPEPAGAASIVWNVDARTGSYLLHDFAEQIEKLCVAAGPDLEVRFRTLDGPFRLSFSCPTLPVSIDELSTQLVHRVAARNHASSKAHRIERLVRALLPGQGYSVDEATWSFATSGTGRRCRHGYAQDQTRRDMGFGREHGEDAEHWTLVEAVPLRVLCPERLDTLYATVRAVGEPAAARAVRRQLDAVS